MRVVLRLTKDALEVKVTDENGNEDSDWLSLETLKEALDSLEASRSGGAPRGT